MTQRQKQYARNIYKGMTQHAAYIDVYHPKYSRNRIDSNASILADHPTVITELARLNAMGDKKAVADVQERKEILTDIMREKGISRIPAIAELNKMDGAYAPEKHEHSIEFRKYMEELREAKQIGN